MHAVLARPRPFSLHAFAASAEADLGRSKDPAAPKPGGDTRDRLLLDNVAAGPVPDASGVTAQRPISLGICGRMARLRQYG